MKLTVYNFFGNDTEMDTMFIAKIVNAVTTLYSNDSIEVIDMFSENIRSCVGCFGCWVKTPGICIHKDVMSSNYKKIMRSDRIVLLMPIRSCFLDSKVKAFIDRLIPLYHPYIEIYEGEMMHEYRYDKYPDIDFYFPDDEMDEENAQIVEDYCFRTAHHFRVNTNRLILSDGQFSKKMLHFRAPRPDKSWQKYTEKFGKIIVYNGSPRGLNSNSMILIGKLIEGIQSKGVSSDEIEIRSLNDTSKHALWANDFHNHSRHIFVMPLYVHSMPSVVKAFIEALKPHDVRGRLHLSFIVQYGFSEQFQSAYLVPYFGQLSNKLNAIYGGTVVKGDMEGIRTRPDSSTSKLYKAFTSLGEQYIQEHQFNRAFVSKLSQPVKLSKAAIIIINLLRLTGITNTLWDKQLRANGVYDRRNDRPYF